MVDSTPVTETLVIFIGIHKVQALRCQELHPWLPSYIKVRPQVFISVTNSAYSFLLVKKLLPNVCIQFSYS